MPTTTITVPTDAFLVGTDNKITITGLKDDDGVNVTDATFTGDLSRCDTGGAVGSSITFSSVGGTNDYEGELPASASLVEGKYYQMIATAENASGKKLAIKIKRIARYVNG